MTYTGLNLGAGHLEIADGWLNVDLQPTPITHVVADLNRYPWPFRSEAFEAVSMLDIYEHLFEPWAPLEECWRVLKPGGSLVIHTGNFQFPNAFNDPSHVRFPTLHTFDYVDRRTMFGAKYPQCTWARFVIVERGPHGQELLFHLRKEALDDGTYQPRRLNLVRRCGCSQN